MRGAICDSAVRPVVIVLLDPASDAGACFFQAPILRRPHFFFLQAAMDPFDVAVALRVMIGRAAMGDPEPPQCFQEPRGSELLISPFWGLNRISVIFAKLNERVPDLRDSAPASAQPKALRNVPFIVKLYERDYYLELVLCAHGFCGFCCCSFCRCSSVGRLV